MSGFSRFFGDLLASGWRGGVELAERGLLPDAVVRWGIRRSLRERLAEQGRGGPAEVRARQLAFAERLRKAPIALTPEVANAQHYEQPPEFFRRVLGPRMKYSCAWFDSQATTLAEAEVAMLERSCRRAGIEDGMDVLDLGSGWGSLALWIAERYPACRVLAVSNSEAQRDWVRAECARRALRRVEVERADAGRFEPGRRFDRVTSVEMFEHMRNWPQLLSRIAGWLRPEGRLFVHVFSHRSYAYPYEDRGDGDWMARNFFTGGIMPSHALLPGFDDHLRTERSWRLDGRHYARTCEAWLRNLDAAGSEVLPLLAGTGDAQRACRRWRLFFLACAELFAFGGGGEWGVSHYRLAPRRHR